METIRDSFAFKSRGVTGVMLLLPIGFAVLFSAPTVVEDSPLDLALDTFAWLLFGIYVFFRVWATIYVGGRKDRMLQTEGPYSITRNPLYFGSFCFGLSAAFFLDSLSLAAGVVLVWFIYIYQVIKAEERFLESRFGEPFREYCRRTPRFFPSPFLYRSDDSLTIELRALRVESKRLLIALLLPISAEIIMHFRMVPWWPHWFRLP